MAGRIDWRGDKYAQAMKAEMRRRSAAAAIRLSSRVKAEISQPGTLRYSVKPGSKRQRTVYNYTHSRPGNPPYKQTGHLRRSITWELVSLGGLTWIGRVGTNLLYGRYLELGTKRMRARPFLRFALRRYWLEIVGILTAKIGPNGLAAIVANQFRSGITGRNF